MLNEILQKLNENSDAIVELLDYYECGKIKVNAREVRFARDDGPESGLNISIRLENNDACLVKDFAHSEVNNIISWLCKEKNADFKSVLLTVKRILNLSDDWRPRRNTPKLFGGVYDCIINKTQPEPKVYPEEILKQYVPIGNERFLKDHLSLASQRRFEIMYNVETHRIVIPIRNMVGELCGTKCRRNYETDNPDDPKYLFELPCQKNLILYGSFQNYQWLYGTDKIFIFEAEKSTIACDSYGYRNAVSIMGNILSESQAKQLLSLNAKEYVFMLDEGLDLEVTFQNAKMLKGFAVMRDVKVSYFDWTQSLEIGEKESPTDGGKEIFEYIIENELIEYQQTT